MRGAAAALSGESTAVGTQAATAFGGGFNRVLSGGLIAAGVVAATGASLLAIGSSFDDAYDTIQAGTGATGDALEGLKDVFRGVVADVPTDFGSAADAITSLNQRLELTGQPLEDMAEQFLNLSNITGEDLNGNIESVTRAFGDWSVATGNQSSVLDKFFRASQASGVSVSELAEGVVQFGAPLRSLGFGLDESIGLFASFGEAGVNTSKVMSGLTQANSRFASGFAESELGVSNLTEAFSGFADGTLTATDAIALFGQRAGTDIFRAIQEGRFDVEEFIEVMRGAGDGINDTADKTRDFGESFEVIRNNIMLLLEGPASALMGWVSAIAGEFETLVQALQAGGIGAAIAMLRDNFDGLGPMMQAVVIGAAVLGGVLLLLAAKAAIAAVAFLAIPLAIAALAAGLVYAYTHFEGFRNVVDAVVQYLAGIDWAGIWDALVSAVQAAIEWIVGTAWPAIVEFAGVVRDAFASVDWAGVWATIVDAVTTAFETIRGVLASVDWAGIWTTVSTAAVTAFTTIQSVVTTVIAVVQGLWATFGDTIVSAATTAWGLISGIVQNAVNLILGIWQVFAGVFTGDWSRVWDGLGQVVSAAWDAMVGLVEVAWTALGTAVQLGLDALGVLWDAGWDAVKSVLRSAWEAIKSAVRAGIDGVVDFLTALPGRATSAVASIVSGLSNKGREAMQGMFNALQNVWDTVRSWLSNTGQRAISAIGNLARTLYDKGAALIQGLWDGMQNVWDSVSGWISDVVGQIGDFFSGLNPFESASFTVTDDRVAGPTLSAFPAEAVSSRYSGQPQPITVRVDPSGADSALVELLRRMIRVEAGGNVQAALGG